MLSFEQAIEQMLGSIPTAQNQETLSLTDAINRICAEDVISPINVPSFNNSAMDGYAIRLSDLQRSEKLSVVGKSLAGHPFDRELPPQSAVKIMTGAMIPQRADTVIMQEDVQVDNDGNVTFLQPAKLGQHIRRVGEDIKKGDVVLKKGSKLTALSLPLLASLGFSQISVFKSLKVALISTGDELISVGESLQMGKIYDTNRFTIRLLLEKLNCEILDFGIIADNEQQFEKVFMQAQQQADLIITSGGVSVGEADFTKKILEKFGQIRFWKIAMKPGKPFAFGQLGKAWFFGLPGNPVSALVTFYQLVQPAIAKLSGYSQWKKSPQLQAITTTPLKKSVGRLDFQRGFYQLNSQGEIEVHPIGFQGSHIFSAFVKSNCFIVLEKERGHVQAGEIVTIEPFNALLN
ncbi:molybdopterin molybdotransferase MoeA [Seminibacterium arietis]|uniref:Molybdopterin molybdenumtransferase n=1 Tax=Seminibacterium arietis TaxID=1173502 RepID=A0ABW3I862_9PAST